MSKISGRLDLTLYGGKEFVKEDFGKMDPYCKVELGKQQFKTKVHKKGGASATWDQTFAFTLKDVSPNEIVHFQVWDEDLLSDDKIGRADIPLSGLAQHTDKKDGAWIQLVEFNNSKKIAGYIRVGVKFDGQGWPHEEAKQPEHRPEHRPPSPKGHYDAPIIQPVYVEPPKPPTPPPAEIKHEYKHEHKLSDTLHEGNALHAGDKIVSANGQFAAGLQLDGNFVVFKGDRPIWATKTPGTHSTYFVLQTDNNLVLYDNHKHPHWASNTNGKGSGKAKLVLQNDGNLVLKDGSDVTLWETGSPQPPKIPDTLKVGEELTIGESLRSQNAQYIALLQSDGNFVIYHEKKGIWSSKTNGSGANKVVLGTDHNLVITGPSGIKWDSGTAGKGKSAKLVLQNNGALVLVDDYTLLWTSQGVETLLTDTLHVGGRLNPGQKLVSQDGKASAVFQADGNLVVYLNQKAKWSTRTNGTGSNVLRLGHDNNLVIAKGTEPKWSSDTAGKGGYGTKLVLQNDGDLVLTDGTTVLWVGKK